jgi:hypothetical protein
VELVEKASRNLTWIVGLALAAASSGCSGGPSTAELYVTIVGQGTVTVSRSVTDPGCDSGTCGLSAIDAGLLAAPYTPDTDVTLVATPAAGWHFVSWQITATVKDQPPSMTTSTAAAILVQNTGVGLNVIATFDTSN